MLAKFENKVMELEEARQILVFIISFNVKSDGK